MAIDGNSNGRWGGGWDLFFSPRPAFHEGAEKPSPRYDNPNGSDMAVFRELLQLEEEPLQWKEEPLQWKEEPLQRKEEPLQRKEKPLQRKEKPLQRKEVAHQQAERLSSKPLVLGDDAISFDYYEFIAKKLNYYGVSCADLEEEAEKVLLQVARNWDIYDPSKGTRKTWVNGICFNVSRNYRRNLRVRNSLAPLYNLFCKKTEQSPEEIVAAKEAHQILLSILDHIDKPELAEMWYLRNFEELSVCKIRILFGLTKRQTYHQLEQAEEAFQKAKTRYEKKTGSLKGGK